MNETFAFILMILMTICATCIVISSFFRIDYFKSEYWIKKLEEEMAHGDDPKLRRYMLIKTALYVVIIMIFVTLLSFTPVRKWLSWMPDTLVAALFISPIAFWLWHWRDQNKLKDQEHTERDLKIKENNDAWDNFLKFQRIANDKKEPPTVRGTAIYAIGEYYTRPKESNFPKQTHDFFTAFVDEYLEEPKENGHIQPPYIKAVHQVIIEKIKYLGANEFYGAPLQGAELIGAKLRSAKLEGAKLFSANLQGANLRCANLFDANLKGAEYDDLTVFPEGFDPEEAGMIRIDK